MFDQTEFLSQLESAKNPLTEQNQKMLLTLAEMGLNREVIAWFLEMTRFKKDHIHYFLGPVVQHQSPWQDTTPEWMYKAVFPERLELIFEEHNNDEVGWRVGPTELAVVMIVAIRNRLRQMDREDDLASMADGHNSRNR